MCDHQASTCRINAQPQRCLFSKEMPQAKPIQQLIVGIIKSSVVQKAAAAEGQSEVEYVHCLMQDSLLQQQQEPMTLSEDSLGSDVLQQSVPDTTAGHHAQRRPIDRHPALAPNQTLPIL